MEAGALVDAALRRRLLLQMDLRPLDGVQMDLLQMDLLRHLPAARAVVAVRVAALVPRLRQRTQPRLRNNRLLLPRKKISPRTVCLLACPGLWANRIPWNS